MSTSGDTSHMIWSVDFKSSHGMPVPTFSPPRAAITMRTTGLLVLCAVVLFSGSSRAMQPKNLARIVEAEIASLKLYNLSPGNIYTKAIDDVSVTCDGIVIKDVKEKYQLLDYIDIQQVSLSTKFHGSSATPEENIAFVCDNDVKCIRTEGIGDVSFYQTNSKVIRGAESRYIAGGEAQKQRLIHDFGLLKSECSSSAGDGASNEQLEKMRTSAVAEVAADRSRAASQLAEPSASNDEPLDDPSPHNDAVATTLAMIGGAAALAPSRPLQAYVGTRRSTNVPSIAPPVRIASVPAFPPAPAASPKVSGSSYRGHPELEATQCLSFHGPTDLYGERVTNHCGYAVAYTFCIDGSHSVLACKAGGDNIGSGSDTIGGGKTQDTGWVDARGVSTEAHWHACKGQLGDVTPVLRTKSIGECLGY